jgi:hypothetical protein
LPIRGLTGKVRTPRSLKIRLGYVRKTRDGANTTPQDTDVFVGKPVDGVNKEILEAYQAKPIADAVAEKDEDKAYALGKGLRMLLPWEFDLQHEGREIALEVLNRAWGRSKGLKCSGDGGDAGDNAGSAIALDEAWAKQVTAKVGGKLEVVGEKRWKIRCVGPACPKWFANKGPDNTDASCHRQLRLQAILLHPATNPEDPNYMKQLGWAEVVSGSFNGMIDVQSGFTMIRALTTVPGVREGRTAYIPFTLKRVSRVMHPEGKRTVKSTLMTDYDMDEVIRFAYGPPSRALARPALRRELLEMAKAEAEYDSFADTHPAIRERMALGLPAPAEDGEEAADNITPKVTSESEPMGVDPDQAAEAAQAAAPSPDELNAFLTPEALNRLKELCGGVPGQPLTMGTFKSILRRAFAEVDGWTPAAADEHPPFNHTRVRHELWIREHIDELLPRDGEVIDA